MKKANRKLLIVVVALLLTLGTVSTATFAWFSMNTKVQATNMELQSSAPTNMLISNNTIDWANGVMSSTDVSGGFAPASSVDGKTFYALASTEGIAETGSVVDNTNIAEVELASVPRVEDENVYYVELPLYIKATEDTSKPNDLQLFLDEFTVSSTNHNLEKTTRISITQVTPYGGANETGPVTINNQGQVLDSESHVLTETTAKVYKYDTVTAVKPVESVSEGTPTLASTDPALDIEDDEDVTVFTVDKDGEYYTTIIVRIWFEGQHEKCINVAAGETVNVSLKWRVKQQ